MDDFDAAVAEGVETVQRQQRERTEAVETALATTEAAALLRGSGLDTPEKMRHAADLAIAQYQEFERVKAAVLQEGRDYVYICPRHRVHRDSPYRMGIHGPGKECPDGHAHIKVPGAEKLASLFGVRLEHLEHEFEADEKGVVVKARYVYRAEWNGTTAQKTGTCQISELYDKTEHGLVARAESRAQRRAILAVLGSADPTAEEAE